MRSRLNRQRAPLFLLGVILCVCISASASTYASSQTKTEPDNTGAVTGLATAKGGFLIEITADGEEKARRYFCGSDQAALKAVKDTEVGSRVRLEWRYLEVFRVVKIEVLKAPARDKKE